MSASALIARLERTVLLRNGVTGALLLAFAALTVMASSAAVLRATRDRNDRGLLAAGQPVEPTRGLAHYAFERGTFAVLPAAPLDGFAVGQSDVHPSHYHITARVTDAQLAADQLENPLMLHAGALDLLFILLYLYPLLIIGVSYDLVASDRANGTLRMLVVQGATLREIAHGRLRTRLALVALLPAAASVLTAAAVDPGMLASPRFLAWTVAAILYGLFWLAVSVHVNARGGSAAANAMALTAAWLLVVVLLPAILNLAARVVYPVPSRVQLAVAMREAAREAVAEGSRALGRYLEDHPSTGTGVEGLRQFYMLQDVRDARIAHQLQPMLSAYEDQLTRQGRFISVAQYASPTVIAQLALTDLAGTSGHRARAFAGQAVEFQRAWKARFPPDLLAADVSTLPDLPTFTFVEEPLAAVAGRTLLPLAALAVIAASLLVTGARRLRYIDVIGA